MNLKNILYRSVAGLVVLAGFFGFSQKALADVKPEFNNNPGDHQLIRVKNITQGDAGYKDSTSAKVGDTLRFNIWVHNNVENSLAKNVKVKATLPSLYALDHSVAAQISADNADSVSGSVPVTLPESGKLDFVSGSTLVYSDVYGGGYKWPNNNLVVSGINLGDVIGCWPYVVQITFETKVVVKPEEPEENPKLTLHKQVSYGDERKNGTWYDAISKDKKKFGPGEYLYYRVTLENTGNATVKDVILEDQLPPYLHWTGGSGTYKSGPNIVTYNVGDVASGAKIVVEYQLRVRSTLPNGERTQENVVVARSSNYQDLQDATVVWLRGPDIEIVEKKREEVEIVTTRVEKVEKEIVEVLPETGGNFLVPNLLVALGSLITGFGLKRLER